MAATFNCPHCNAVYPVKPVLVGRAVRCTTCKNAFRLREDGVADKVESPSQPPATPQAQEPAAVLPPVDALKTPTHSTSSSQISTTAKLRKAELSAKQDAVRRTMAANLSTAASVAMEAEAKKEESTRIKRKKSQAFGEVKKKTGGGAVGDISPAVLSDVGEREHRNNLMWLVGAIIVVCALGGCLWMSSMHGAAYDAVVAFTAPVEQSKNYAGERIAAIQERALLFGAPPLIDVGSLSVQSSWSIASGKIAPVFADTLKDCVLLKGLDLWVDAKHAKEVADKWDPKAGAKQIEKLGKSGARIIENAQVMAKFKESGLTDDGIDIIMTLLRGRTDRNGANEIAQRFLQGETPENIEVAPFSGEKGRILMQVGGRFTSREVNYKGRLLRFASRGWPGSWKILDIQIVSSAE